MRRLFVLGLAGVFCVGLAAPAQATFGTVLPTLSRNLVSYYDFEHPVRGNKALEQDRGRSGTALSLVNGGADMRVRDGAFWRSRNSLQLQQINPGNRNTPGGTPSGFIAGLLMELDPSLEPYRVWSLSGGGYYGEAAVTTDFVKPWTGSMDDMVRDTCGGLAAAGRVGR